VAETLPTIEYTEQELRFIEEYCVDLNPKQAALRAGHLKTTAGRWAQDLLRDTRIQHGIDLRREEMNKASVVSAEWIRTRLKTVAERCMQAEPVMIREGGKMVESGEYKFDSNGANKALEHLGKHIGMFIERSVVTIETELKQLTDEQLNARLKALIEESATLDLVQNAAGIFEAPIKEIADETEQDDRPEHDESASTGPAVSGPAPSNDALGSAEDIRREDGQPP